MRIPVLIASLCFAGLAGAANLQISPVAIHLRGEQKAASVTLQNMGTEAVYGQVRVYEWDQSLAEDVLTPTRQVIASPPIVEVAPGGSQVIRLVRTGPGTAGETSYRVLIDEIAKEGEAASTGVDFRLRYSVPLFVLPAGEAGNANLSWRIYRKDAYWMLGIANSGQLHAQIGAMVFVNHAGKEFEVSKGLFGYVLPGKTREWRLPLDGGADLAGAVSIKATVNAKAIVADGIASRAE
ncbi:MAG: fimbria/pilus periplasmic chaperone [Pseudomonadota bacterium]